MSPTFLGKHYAEILRQQLRKQCEVTKLNRTFVVRFTPNLLKHVCLDKYSLQQSPFVQIHLFFEFIVICRFLWNFLK